MYLTPLSPSVCVYVCVCVCSQSLLCGIWGLLLVLTVVEVCVSISGAVFSGKAIHRRGMHSIVSLRAVWQFSDNLVTCSCRLSAVIPNKKSLNGLIGDYALQSTGKLAAAWIFWIQRCFLIVTTNRRYLQRSFTGSLNVPYWKYSFFH